MNSKRVGFIIFIISLVALYFLNRKDVTLEAQNGFELQTISPNGVELKSVIHLNNTNLLSSTIKNIHEKFYINGTLVGIIDNEINQGIPGRKVTDFPVSIRFSKDDLNKTLPLDSSTGSKSEDAVKVSAEGEITFQNLIGGGDIKIHTVAMTSAK